MSPPWAPLTVKLARAEAHEVVHALVTGGVQERADRRAGPPGGGARLRAQPQRTQLGERVWNLLRGGWQRFGVLRGQAETASLSGEEGEVRLEKVVDCGNGSDE